MLYQLSYSRIHCRAPGFIQSWPALYLVGRGGFEPPKAAPTDLQSVPFDRSGTSPKSTVPLEGFLAPNKRKKSPLALARSVFPHYQEIELFPGHFALLELAKGLEPPTY